MKNEKKKVGNRTRKEIREWIILLLVFGVLYFTGWYRPIAAGLQRLVVWSGLVNAHTEVETGGRVNTSWQLQTLDGTLIPSTVWKGKVVLINFWATWCPPCIAEMPGLESITQEFKANDQIVFLFITREDDPQKVTAWLERKGYDLPVYRPASPLPPALAHQALPTTFVLDTTGRVAYHKSGLANYDTDDFKEFLLELTGN